MEFRLYIQRRYELTIEDGCIFVVPPKGRAAVISNESHPGIVKGLAKWPAGLNTELEECVKKCTVSIL